MWYCPACQSPNRDRSRRCAQCGRPCPAQGPSSGANYPRRRGLRRLWGLVALAVLAVCAAVFLFSYHIWSPATCTEPAVCRICGRQGAPALGHTAFPATCTEPAVCARCGQELSPALGHDWQPATYDAPETCSRCGREQGEPRGWVGKLSGRLGEETVSLAENDSSRPYLLDESVLRCLRISLCIRVDSYSGDPFGTWGLYARDLNGSWQRLDSFVLYRSACDDYVTYSFALGGQPSFDALCLVPLFGREADLDYSFYYQDVQVLVD